MGRCARVTKADGTSARVFQMEGRGGKVRGKACEGCSNKRCCENCAHVIRPGSHWLRIILARWAGLLLCLNRADCPGVISEARPGGSCRNFRPRRRPGERCPTLRPPNENVRYIPLTRNLFAMVDAEDFEELSKYKWHASDGRRTFYAAGRVGKKTITMHRVIMKPPKGMVVDHIDGNGLNNCKSNLRICTIAQNNANSRTRGSRCGYRGVHKLEWNTKNKYEAYVHYQGERIHGGVFPTALEAALARDRLARKFHGEHAYLNFPNGVPPGVEVTDSPVSARGRPSARRA